MRGDIVLAGFVLTADEWEGLDTMARAQLLRAGGRWQATPARMAAGTTPPPRATEALPPIPPPPRRREVEDPYEVYEVVPPR